MGKFTALRADVTYKRVSLSAGHVYTNKNMSRARYYHYTLIGRDGKWDVSEGERLTAIKSEISDMLARGWVVRDGMLIHPDAV